MTPPRARAEDRTACVRCHARDADAWLCSACQHAIAITAACVALAEGGWPSPTLTPSPARVPLRPVRWHDEDRSA